MSITVGAKVEVLNTWNAHVGSVCTVVSRGSCWIRVKNEDEEEFGVRGEKHLKLIEAAPELEEKPLIGPIESASCASAEILGLTCVLVAPTAKNGEKEEVVIPLR